MAPKNETNPTKAAPARGRIVASRYMNASGSTTTRPQRLAAQTTGTSSSLEKKPPRLNATSTISSKPSQGSLTAAKLSKPSAGSRLGTDPAQKPAVKSNPGNRKLTPTPAQSDAKAPTPSRQEHVPTRTADPLQVAAQLYPWMYMTSTLQSCFESAELSAHKALETRAKELSEQEADIADQRVRFEAERLIAFYEELSTDKFATEAPFIMQTFMRHGKTCTELTSEALRLATQSQNQINHALPIQSHNNILTKLENARALGTQLESSITRLLASNGIELQSQSSSHIQILSVFSACLPILRARTSNLSASQDLIQSSKENIGMSVQIESMRLSA